jgi:tetratricopeptide (TPR) repeat protein
VRLAELERHVLGWNRGVDVMSELIPAIYFDFLRGGPPEPLIPIFHHNQMDLRGLAGLAAHTLSLLADPETRGKDALELFGVSRICERRGEAARARKFYSQSIAAELPEETGRAARKSLARLAKRDGDLSLACELWTAMLGNSREGLDAYEQLAIHYERRSREIDRAAVLVRAALAELRRAHRLGAVAADVQRRYRTRFEARLARLERKVGRTLLDAAEAMEAESKPPVTESN